VYFPGRRKEITAIRRERVDVNEDGKNGWYKGGKARESQPRLREIMLTRQSARYTEGVHNRLTVSFIFPFVRRECHAAVCYPRTEKTHPMCIPWRTRGSPGARGAASRGRDIARQRNAICIYTRRDSTKNDFSTSGFLSNDGMSIGIKEDRLAGCEWRARESDVNGCERTGNATPSISPASVRSNAAST